MSPPVVDELLDNLDRELFPKLFAISPLVKGKYEHWDKVRHLTPPAGLTSEEWWLGLKLARNQLLKPIPLTDKQGTHFSYGTPDSVLRFLHQIDQLAGGQIQISEAVTNPATRDRYVVSSLIEESIKSSQLEGASTTVEVAKDMLRSGRRPTDRSEQMIVNNYRAMGFIRENRSEALTPDFVFTLHRMLTERTLDDPAKAGCFRSEEDAIRVEDPRGNVLHIPPRALELSDRLTQLCEFANSRSAETFLHPVVRAIALHFWLAYDHPFVDGNGRTARALFYWSMLSQGYWLAEYVSISRILKGAPGQYSRSFLYTETDDNDLTYFLEYHLAVFRRAIDQLRHFLERKAAEVREVEALLRQASGFNHRQLALLTHALRHPGARYSIESHRRSHNVVYQTARTDLLKLVDRGLLRQSKVGRTYYYSARPDLAEHLEAGVISA